VHHFQLLCKVARRKRRGRRRQRQGAVTEPSALMARWVDPLYSFFQFLGPGLLNQTVERASHRTGPITVESVAGLILMAPLVLILGTQ